MPTRETRWPRVCEDQTEEEARRSDEVAELIARATAKIAFFLMLNVGLILTAVAMVLFKTPNHLAFGGTTGVAIVLGALFPQLPVSSFMWVLNVALVILGFVFLDRKATIWSSFASIALSAYVSLFEWILRRSPSRETYTLTSALPCFSPRWEAPFVFDIGASTAAPTSWLRSCASARTWRSARRSFAVGIAIVCAAAVIYGPRTGLWCILGLVAKTFVVDTAIESIRQRKVCQVICKYPHEVEEFIVRKPRPHRHGTDRLGRPTPAARVIILTTVLARRRPWSCASTCAASTAAPSSPITSSSRSSAEASAASTSGPSQIGDVFKFAQTWDRFVFSRMNCGGRTCPLFAQKRTRPQFAAGCSVVGRLGGRWRARAMLV